LLLPYRIVVEFSYLNVAFKERNTHQ